MKGGGQQGQSGSGSMDVLWISAFFVLLLAFLWFRYSEVILNIVYNINTFKLYMSSKFISLIDKLGLFDLSKTKLAMNQTYEGLQSMLGQNAGTKELYLYTAKTNSFFRYFYVPVASLYIVFLLFISKANYFKKTYDMKKLKKQEVENWPYISPVDKNLIKQGLDTGPWAMSTQPLQFVLNNELADKRPSYEQTHLDLRDKAAFEVLSRHMGPFWTGRIDCMPNYTKALFAIFAAKGNGDDGAARDMIDQIAKSSATGSLNFHGSTMLIAKHIRSKGVGMAVSPHAYVLTAMASMLEFARTGGVLAMAELIWLKKVDRRLWYMLQSVGRQTPFVEAAAPYAHWVVEKRLRRPLKVPMVNESVKAVVKALEDIKYVE